MLIQFSMRDQSTLKLMFIFSEKKIAKGVLSAIKIGSSNQTADILTKHLPVYQHKFLCEKLKFFDMFGKQIKGEC